MAKQKTPTKAITEPKGRPTRARGEFDDQRRAFGPAAQWIAVAAVLLGLFIVLVIATGGGNFRTFNGGQGGFMLGSLQAILTT
ncbi:MAG: hypothetical protein ACI9OJ_005747 [Myxococcota bacterium]|jgi:hypothetical protein